MADPAPAPYGMYRIVRAFDPGPPGPESAGRSGSWTAWSAHRSRAFDAMFLAAEYVRPGVDVPSLVAPTPCPAKHARPVITGSPSSLRTPSPECSAKVAVVEDRRCYPALIVRTQPRRAWPAIRGMVSRL